MIQLNKRYGAAAAIAGGLTASAGGLMTRFHLFGTGDASDFFRGAIMGMGIGVCIALLVKARRILH